MKTLYIHLQRRFMFMAIPALLALCIFGIAHAQTGPVAPPTFAPLAEYGHSGLGELYKSNVNDPNALSNFLNQAFTIVISIGAMAAVLRLVYAGYMYMGDDMWSSKTKAKEIIRAVVLGLLLLLSIYLILYQINPQILDLNILKNVPAGGGFNNVPAGGGFNTVRNCPPGASAATCISTGTGPTLTGLGSGYSAYRWTDVQGGLCSSINGPGWVLVDGKFCGATPTYGTATSCCGYDSSYTPPVVAAPSSTYGNVGDIPAGSWCYEAPAHYYSCTNNSSSCGDTEARDSAAIVSTCRQY